MSIILGALMVVVTLIDIMGTLKHLKSSIIQEIVLNYT